MCKLNKGFLFSGFVGFITLVILSGCSSTRSYPNNLSKNVTASLSKESDAGVKARVDVFLLNKQCKGPYQGSVWFGKTPGKIGIKENKQTLLSFKFLLSDWLTGKHSITTDALIKARSGYRYEAKLSYVDKAYETFIYEINRRTGKRNPINIVDIQGCIEG